MILVVRMRLRDIKQLATAERKRELGSFRKNGGLAADVWQIGIGQSPSALFEQKSCCSPEFPKQTQSREYGRKQSGTPVTMAFIDA